MKIEITQEQQKMLISLIENTNFSGKDSEVVSELKKAIKNDEINAELMEKAMKSLKK